MREVARSGNFNLVPSARLQRYLGQELIADSNLAIIEFVKNAYDANATRVDIEFALSSSPSTLIISDNGEGMSLESFEEDWMQPGFSRKSITQSEGNQATESQPNRISRQLARTPLGEKGLGRFAAGRLGSALDVYTRKSKSESCLHVEFNWSWFDDMYRSLSDIEIPYRLTDMEIDNLPASGTVIVISDLRLKWDGYVPGRAVPGRSRTRLGRLKEDLQLLLRPLDGDHLPFEIELSSDAVLATSDEGRITPVSASRSSDYVYEFEFEEIDDRLVCTRRSLCRSKKIADEFSLSQDVALDVDQPADETEEGDVLQKQQLCGPFSGAFYYDPPPRAKRAKQVNAIGHGVLLYRDGALVEPYGMDKNDWVGVEARKAQRQGHALIQPLTFSGEVRIGRTSNPELLDMANRQGLIDNEQARVFFAYVQEEFRRFEKTITPELESRWKPISQRAAEQAVDRLELVRLRMDSIAHALRQPLFGIQTETVSLGSLIDQLDVSEDLRYRLNESLTAIRDYVTRLTSQMDRVKSVDITEFQSIGVDELVQLAQQDVADLAERSGIAVQATLLSSRTATLPVDLIQAALVELCTNAIESPRNVSNGYVDIQVTDLGRRDIRIRISDDGEGLSDVAPGTPLSAIGLSTKGRPRGGLVLVENSIALVKGRVTLAKTSANGATFTVDIPGSLEGLETDDG